jgi:hypothetical protein
MEPQTRTVHIADGDEIARLLDELLQQGRYADLAQASRQVLERHRFYLWHMYLIVALLRAGRREEAARELDALFAYKFNLADRAWPEIREAFPERFVDHFVLSTMTPDLGLETQSQFARHWEIAYPLADKPAFDEEVQALLAAAVPALAPLARDATRIATFGSCFAANLAQQLKAAGVDASNLLIEESINSPLANREFLAAIADGESARFHRRIVETFGGEFLARARERLAAAQVLVITLGVAPTMFHRGSNEFAFLVNHKELLRAGAIHMRTPTVGEVRSIIGEMLGLARRINPDARTYLSISPVPLAGTIEMPHAMVADCVSKSTLRAALHEVLAAGRPANVHYWPSFEIVRWLGGHTSLPVYGEDDGSSRHVSNWVVQLIVERFARHLFGAP